MTFEDLPPLETECPTCKGTGRVPILKNNKVYKHESACPDCRRAGLVLSDFGKAIIVLIRKYSFNAIEDRINSVEHDVKRIERSLDD